MPANAMAKDFHLVVRKQLSTLGIDTKSNPIEFA